MAEATENTLSHSTIRVSLRVEEAEDESGGWRYDFIEETPNDFLCVICLLPMRDPMQISSCGHCMCQTCLEKVISSTALCPQDREPVSKSDVFKDKRMERSIMALKVRCQNSERKCDWTGELVDLLKRHVNICKKEPFPCPREKCTAQPLREVLHLHYTQECEWRTVSCLFCNGEMLACDLEVHRDSFPREKQLKEFKCLITTDSILQRHVDICKKEPFPCPREKCTAQPLREVLYLHYTQECEWRTVSCLFCNGEMLACDLEAHLETDCLEYPISCSNDCGASIPMKEMESHAHQCPDGFVLCSYSEVGCSEKVKSKDMESHRKLMQEMHMDQLLNALLTFKVENERKTKQLEEENQSLKREFEEAIKNWQEENQRLSGEIENLKPQLGIIPITETKSSFESFVCFVWKINDAKKHLKKIEADMEYKIRSDTFSTGEKGYKAQIFLVQDARDPMQKNLHFQIVKGDHDNILPWPCRLCVESIVRNKSKFKFLAAKKDMEQLVRPKDSVLTVKGSQQLRVLSHYKALKKDGYIIDDSICIDIRVTKFDADKPCSLRSLSAI